MIRFASPSDAEYVAPLMFQAMEDVVYKLIGKKDKQEALEFLKILFKRENNQYSYQNTLVYQEENIVVGSLVFYKGADLYQLRKPVLELANEMYANKVTMEDETKPGETYIDTLSVDSKTQGMGIASLLLRYLIDFAKKNQLPKLSLLVDLENPKAKKLYTKIGFVSLEEQTLAGGFYLKMIYSEGSDK